MSTPVVQVLAALGLAAAAVLLAVRMRLGLGREVAVAAVRAVVQLAVVGAIVAAVFHVPALSVAFVAVMATAATVTAGSRLPGVERARVRAALAIAPPALATTGLLVLVGAFDATPRAIVPTVGILLGGAMVATSLTGRRMLEGLRDDHDEIEVRLSLGDDARTAMAPVVRRAVATGLTPAIDQTRTVGLVTLPGTFVGLILGGASPAAAARIQLLVLLALLFVELVAAVLIGASVARGATAPGERVVVQEEDDAGR